MALAAVIGIAERFNQTHGYRIIDETYRVTIVGNLLSISRDNPEHPIFPFKVNIDCRYVHQLQHSFKSCEIMREITL